LRTVPTVVSPQDLHWKVVGSAIIGFFEVNAGLKYAIKSPLTPVFIQCGFPGIQGFYFDRPLRFSGRIPRPFNKTTTISQLSRDRQRMMG
jgi:hypothetical protein